MSSPTRPVQTHAGVRAVLADPDFTVPPVPPSDQPGGIAWLRASVARFSSGPDHTRRRALASTALSGVDVAALRPAAGARTRAVLAAAGGQPVELITAVARVVPVATLADALGLPDVSAADVSTVAGAYHPHVLPGPAADAAVARLVRACGGTADEVAAARIGLLVQACDATAGLVGNAVLAMLRGELADPVDAILTETLRHDPPVRLTRRVAGARARTGGGIAAGTLVELDIAAANRDGAVFADPDRFDPSRSHTEHLTFGFGARACPGRDHATAIAGGIVEAVRGCRLVAESAAPDPSANPLVPAQVWVSAA